MAIKTGLSGGVIAIEEGDTVLVDRADRIAIEALILHNRSGVDVSVGIYEAPGTSSAGGSQIGFYVLLPNQSADVVEVIGQGYFSAENIIANSDGAGVNARYTYTQYSGESI